jgi:thiamine kinase-like enzyme
MSAADRIATLPRWPQRPSLRRLAAGRTNENYVVECAGERYFARAGVDLPEHGILRRREALAARFAAGLGLAPALHFAEDGLMVTDYLDGRPLTPAMVAEPSRLTALAALFARLHRAPPPAGLARFDPVMVVRRYLEQLNPSALGAAERRHVTALLAQAPRLTAAALIHADPVPENVIAAGERLWLVDWEYAGLGDPATDLAMLAMNCDLERPAIETLVAAHGFCALDTVLALRPVVAAREALWCLMQIQLRGPEGDLADYASRCLARIGLTRP